AGAATADPARTARILAYVSARTPIDALTPIDSVYAERSGEVWRAAVDLILDASAPIAEAPRASRPSLVVLMGALIASPSHAAARERQRLDGAVQDPLLRALAAAGTAPAVVGSPEGLVLSGEVASRPRHFAIVLLLTIT